MKSHCLFTKISCFPFFLGICFVLNFIAWDPDCLLLFMFICTALAKSWLLFLLEVVSWILIGHFHYHTFVFCLAGLESFFHFLFFFFTSLDPKVKRALTKLDCIALAEVKDVTLFKNLITPLAKFRTPELWSFWMIYSQEFLDSSSAFAMESFRSSVICVCWAVWPLIWCLLTIWCLSNKTIGTISLWSIFFPSITKA